ncbi:hypothetical protein GCM10029978_006940 [Actinoallomurus acanthiterrae]
MSAGARPRGTGGELGARLATKGCSPPETAETIPAGFWAFAEFQTRNEPE